MAAAAAATAEGSGKNKRILCLFDVDGTLTIARKKASPETIECVQCSHLVRLGGGRCFSWQCSVVVFVGDCSRNLVRWHVRTSHTDTRTYF